MVKGKAAQVSNGKENLKPPTPRLTTYNAVANLKAVDLTNNCLKHNIDIKFPKKAKQIFLCHALGIPTTGDHSHTTTSSSTINISVASLTDTQQKEFGLLTPKYLSQIQNRKRDLTKVPDIEELYVKNYLLNTNIIDKSSARTYKLTRPFDLKKFVHSVVFFEHEASESFCIIRGMCNPSQATSPEEIKVVFAIVDKVTGTPYGGYCTCTVGCTETCGHIGALLFAAAEFMANGTTQTPSCTEKLCSWTDPKGSKSIPAVASEIKIKKQESTQKRTTNDYGKRVAQPELPEYEAVVNLRFALLNATHHIRQYCPAVHILNPSRFSSDESVVNPEPPPAILKLPDTVPYNYAQLAYSNEEAVNTTPATIVRVTSKQFNSESDSGFENAANIVYEKCENMNFNIDEVDQLTIGQASNKEWHNQRRGAITATKFHDVVKVFNNSKKKYDSLVKNIMGTDTFCDKLRNVPAIKWGRAKENSAKTSYIDKFKKLHKDLHIQEHGLMMYSECHFIRGSPDGIVSCSCHGQRLIEIRCPYSVRFLSVREAVDSGNLKYLKLESGRYHLNNSSEGYYDQVQGLMGICGLELCNFVVWTEKEMVTVPVHFNEEHFKNNIVPACKDFFKKVIIPKLLVNTSTDSSASDEITTRASSSASDETTASSSASDETTASSSASGKTTASSSASDETTALSSASGETTASSSASDETTASSSASADPTPILQKILTEKIPVVYRCKNCSKLLPHVNIADDNSNASVGCDCPNCSGCDTWYCWPCAHYDEEQASEGCNWFCRECVRECDIVY